MSKVVTKIGPDDHGQRMSLEEFESAEGVEGHLYELSRGVITVIDVPRPRHGAQVDATREQFSAYRRRHRQRIHRIFTGSECKILLADLVSERHPDLAIYLDGPPDDEPDVWARWVPALVIEIVSRSSRKRDYQEKPEEYLRFGVREYWIIDADKRQMTVMRRSRGRWSEQIVRPGEPFRTRLLPGLEFDLAAVFEAAGEDASK